MYWNFLDLATGNFGVDSDGSFRLYSFMKGIGSPISLKQDSDQSCKQTNWLSSN